MDGRTDVSMIFNTFFHLVNELEAFADVSQLKIAFDRENNVFLIGSNFQEQLQCNFTLHREVKTELRQLIAQHCPRVPPETITDSSNH
jgi:hypothetical protein